MNDRVLSPGPSETQGRTTSGVLITLPHGWTIVPPGDPGLTRRIKATGNYWVVQEKKGRKVFSRGVWAPEETVVKIRADLERERDTPAYQKQRAAQAKKRDETQVAYVEDFTEAVYHFLRFDPVHEATARDLARVVSAHATPVGSGTVARTKRIPIEQRAESAVIAWMRHQTTAYDQLKIPRVAGKRREVRRMLAERSRELLDRYRRGHSPATGCPLITALRETESQESG